MRFQSLKRVNMKLVLMLNCQTVYVRERRVSCSPRDVHEDVLPSNRISRLSVTSLSRQTERKNNMTAVGNACSDLREYSLSVLLNKIQLFV